MVWSLFLAVLMLGPALGPGLVLSYDMVWVPDLTLRPDFWGLGTSLPRAVPSDTVVALLDDVVGGPILQKVVLMGSLAGGGVGIDRLVRDLLDAALGARLAAISVYQWNAFLAERLLLGHWTMLLCYAVVPWVICLARRWRSEGRLPALLLVLVPLGSLSASAGLATGFVLLVSVAGRDLRRLAVAAAVVVAANAPWLVAGILHAGSSRADPRGAALFALAGEGPVPAPLAALTLGGVWNREVVPASRTGLLGWMSVLLVVLLVTLGLRYWWQRLGPRDAAGIGACWLVGYLLALVTWVTPATVATVGEHVPGGGVLRDGSRLLVLCAPALATVTAAATTRAAELVEASAARALVVGGLVALPVLLLSDAAWGLHGRLRAVDLPADYAAARRAIETAPEGDVLVLPLSSYRRPSWNHGLKVLDPAGRSQPRDFAASDVLVVSGIALTGEDPRVADAAEALAAPTPATRAARLAELGFGVLLVDREAPDDVPAVDGEAIFDGSLLQVVTIAGARPTAVPVAWVAAMSGGWAAFGGLVAGAALLGCARRLRRQRPR